MQLSVIWGNEEELAGVACLFVSSHSLYTSPHQQRLAAVDPHFGASDAA